MTFRNRLYMSILHTKCPKKKHKPQFNTEQLKSIEYINTFSGIGDPNVLFDPEIMYAEENARLIAELSGQ